MRTKTIEIEHQAVNKKVDRFVTEYNAGKLHISGHTDYAAPFLQTVVASGLWPEFLSEHTSSYSLRPLWIQKSCDEVVYLCDRFFELGFNAVMFSQETFLEHIDKIHEHGLKVIYKPTLPVNLKGFSPAASENIQEIKDLLMSSVPLHKIDYLFWESGLLYPQYHFHTKARDFLLNDLLLKEVAFLEQLLPKSTSLIFYLPANDQKEAQQQTKSISYLLNEAGPKTTLAFPAVAGKVTADHSHFHPFFEHLTQTYATSSTNLLPIYNTGSIEQGSGYWPNFCFDLPKHFAQVSTRHAFCGALHICDKIPEKGSINDANLWIAGQALWSKRSVDLLAKVWFEVNCKDCMKPHFFKDLAELRACIVILSELREESKVGLSTYSLETQKKQAIALFARLKLLEEKLPHSNLFNKHSFFQDARRILLHYIQVFRLPFTELHELETKDSGIWTSLKNNAVIFHSEPMHEVNPLDSNS